MKNSNLHSKIDKIGMSKIICMFLIPLIFYPILDIGGKSLGEYFALFMLGYFLLSNDHVIKKLEDNKWILFTLTIVFILFWIIFFNKYIIIPQFLLNIYYRITMWISVLCIFAMGKHFLNFTNKITIYMSNASFSVFIIHQSWIVAIGYCVFEYTSSPYIQATLIMLISIILTFLTYEVFRKIPVTRFMFGIKKIKNL